MTAVWVKSTDACMTGRKVKTSATHNVSYVQSAPDTWSQCGGLFLAVRKPSRPVLVYQDPVLWFCRPDRHLRKGTHPDALRL